MKKTTYRESLLPRAQHIGDIVAQVKEWQGTGWKNYNCSMPLDSLLLEEGNVWFFRPGDQRARVEFQAIGFKGFDGLQYGIPEHYDTVRLVVTDKDVDNSKGKADIETHVEWSETNKNTQEAMFKQVLGIAAETGLEFGTEYAKASVKITASSETEWGNRNISEHATTVKIDEKVITPPGVHEIIKVELSKNKMRERITGSIDLEHKVVVVSARPDNSYYYVLVWNSFADFLRCLDKTAPQGWTGAKELARANIRQLNLDCVREPSKALIDTYNEYENALSLKIVRTPLN